MQTLVHSTDASLTKNVWWTTTLLNANARAVYKSMTLSALTMEKATQAHAPCELRPARVKERSKLWGKDIVVSFKVARSFPAVPLSSDWKYMKRLHQIEFYRYLVGSLSRQRNTLWEGGIDVELHPDQHSECQVLKGQIFWRKRKKEKSTEKWAEKWWKTGNDSGGKLSIFFFSLMSKLHGGAFWWQTSEKLKFPFFEFRPARLAVSS